jgi:hypothetical protein
MQTRSAYPLMRSARTLACGLGVLIAAAAAAGVPPETERDETERWVPSLSVSFDALGQKGEGSITSGPVLGPPLDPFDTEQDAVLPGNGCLVTSTSPFGPPVITRSNALCESFRPNPGTVMGNSQSSDTSIAALVGGSLELMTPALFDALLRPRLFAHGDFAGAWSFERNLAGEGSPGKFGFPDGLERQIPVEQDDVEELAITGQGSRARMQVRTYIFSGGAGIAFTLDVFGRRVRLKPSFEYAHYEMDLLGVVQRAIKVKDPSGSGDLSGFRKIILSHKDKESYDGIGPGLELEIDAGRLGPVVPSVFIMGRGYHLFGDLETSFTETNRFGESVTWTIEPGRWAWRSGVGFRLRWLP